MYSAVWYSNINIHNRNQCAYIYDFRGKNFPYFISTCHSVSWSTVRVCPCEEWRRRGEGDVPQGRRAQYLNRFPPALPFQLPVRGLAPGLRTAFTCCGRDDLPPGSSWGDEQRQPGRPHRCTTPHRFVVVGVGNLGMLWGVWRRGMDGRTQYRDNLCATRKEKTIAFRPFRSGDEVRTAARNAFTGEIEKDSKSRKQWQKRRYIKDSR